MNLLNLQVNTFYCILSENVKRKASPLYLRSKYHFLTYIRLASFKFKKLALRTVCN